MPALTETQINDALKSLPGWAFENNTLTRHFKFHNFREAMSFIVRLGLEAETLGHHPDLHNVYNTVDIALSTHDAGDKVTDKDVALAQAINAFNWSK